eukprot:TRINITY_DN4_c1_g1_i9.p1 TRINITY_DN4_c1_g1~~TRINITY_DN4_c1_g1_i9.p1  ORF type:complete len:687 (-),score=117.75 TRINITY_DN4_c1_g1_i9:442-2502(-)
MPVGKNRDVRFFALFRFKLWWTTQRMGSAGKEIPMETEFLMLRNDKDGEDTVYTVFLPIVEGPFRASFRGDEEDKLQLCLESGDTSVVQSSFTHSVFITAGADPFKTITAAIKAMQAHLQTFRHREEKKLPGIVDWFGWCTWDAFYTEVSAEGVEKGLRSLAERGIPPRFVIIDDGWQCLAIEEKQKEVSEKVFVNRLTHLHENHKFEKTLKNGEIEDATATGLQDLVRTAKEKYQTKYVYVWHGISGYWGGVMPDAPEMEGYEPRVILPKHSPAVVSHEPVLTSDEMGTHGIGLVNPSHVFRFYNDLHSYLKAAGIDGVKVDIQCVLESLASGYGGRVALTNKYHKALDASVALHFPDNGIIASMSHGTEALYCSMQSAVIRASEDFYPKEPVTNAIHIAAVAYNSVFLGEFMVPDWDMFYSVHPAAEYHAASRAISGGPLYISDKPGHHDFQLLRKLVFPDGSVPRARLPGRPTIDSLFSDANRDGKSLLKIWNMNKYTGVLGVFHCQGAAWSFVHKKYFFHDTDPPPLTGTVKAQDVHLLAEAADEDWNGDSAIYFHTAGKLVRAHQTAEFSITLKPLEKEIYTIAPIKRLEEGLSFAPIGLIDMFNSGGAIRELQYDVESGRVEMGIYGCGRLGAYSSVRPTQCLVNSSICDFNHDSPSGLLVLELGIPRPGQQWKVCVDLV